MFSASDDWRSKVTSRVSKSNLFERIIGVLTESGVHLSSIPCSSEKDVSGTEDINTVEPRKKKPVLLTPPSPSQRPSSWKNRGPIAVNLNDLSRSQSSTPYSESTAAAKRRREALAARAAAQSKSKLLACRVCGTTSSCAQLVCELCGENIKVE